MHTVDAAGDTARMKERLTWAMGKLGLGQEERSAWLVWPLQQLLFPHIDAGCSEPAKAS